MDERQSRGRRAERNLTRLSGFWSTVEDDADAAATKFASTDEAAEAVVIGELAGLEYTAYQVDTRPPKPEDVAIQDLHEGWTLFVAHGDAPTTMDEDHASEARYQRRLADPILHIGEVRLRLPKDRVVLAKIGEKEQRRADDRRLWLNLYAEYRLLAGGWRPEHPAVRDVLIDPAGERVDITRMDPKAVRELISPTLVA